MSSDEAQYDSLLGQIRDACRIPIGSTAALAYWGDVDTDRWWLLKLSGMGASNPRAERFD